MRVSKSEFARIKAMARKAKRIDRIADNLALSVRGTQLQAPGTPQDAPPRHWGSRDKGYAFGRVRKARKPKTSRKRLVAQLDELCSQYVRKRDGAKTGGLCVFGCGRPIFCWFHFIKRSRSLKTRWDHEDNLVASCAPCNGYMEHNEAPFWVWYIKNKGADRMEALEARSHGSANFSIADLEAILADLTNRMRLL